MYEIGSFIEYKKEFFDAKNDKFSSLVFFKSGREALRYLVDYFKIRTIFLPSYFCNEVTVYLRKIKGLKIKEYAVDEKFRIKKNALTAVKNNGGTAILIVDFFGRRDPNYAQLIGLLRRNGIVILSDRTHSVLNEYHDYYDVEFASIRKLFVNLPGAYAKGIKYISEYSKLDLRLSLALLSLKARYLKNNRRALKKRFLEGMRKEEKFLGNFYKNIQAVRALQLERVLCRADINKMKKARKNNYRMLSVSIKFNNKITWLDLGYAKNETPAYALIKCRNFEYRERLKSHLIENNIYPPVHWPNGTGLSRLLLSIPIDHRYSPENMRHVGSVINNFR